MNKASYKDKYVHLEDGERQYDDYDLTETNIVPARYVKSKISFDNGNMFIEALPRPREGVKEIFEAYNREIIQFSEEDKKSMKLYEKFSAVSLLRQLRFPLPFHQVLEDETYMAILNSYRNRSLSIGKSADGLRDCGKLIGKDGAATNAGFSLLGYSGCGKSSALEILFSNYPHVIQHTLDDGTVLSQIVYLVVNCSANSNFSALYVAIGTAIDKALGYTEPVYERVVTRVRTLGEKADKVRELIERFAIGIIVFDEIQLIDFKTTKENSIESLMTLANKTKVAMGVVGTEDAFDLMFNKLRTGRRFGESIIGHEYCNNYKYFANICSALFNYQWFDQHVELTEELAQALYKYSRGIVDELIGIYIFMQIDYLKAKTKPKVNAEYVLKTVQKHYPGLQQLLENLDDPVSEARRAKLVKDGNAEMVHLLEEASKLQAQQAELIIKEQHDPAVQNNKKVLMDIVESIMDITEEYDMATIMAVAAKVIGLKSNANASVKELKKKTFERLQQQKDNVQKSKKNEKDALHISMLNDIIQGD